jgi:hypothetical protein
MEPAFNHAEDMLRRVSPEGRALAHRQRVERQRRSTRLVGLCVLVAAVLALALYLLGLAGIAIGGAIEAGAVAIFVVACAAILWTKRPKVVTAATLPVIPLTALPSRAGDWLEERRGLLPPPALPLVDALTQKLSGLGPQLEKVEADGPGAAAIRKLIAVELPDLVERYRNIPASVAPAEATAQLTQGLQIIDGEVGRLSSDLASGSFDALATQNRYLQLKYDAGLGGGS